MNPGLAANTCSHECEAKCAKKFPLDTLVQIRLNFQKKKKSWVKRVKKAFKVLLWF